MRGISERIMEHAMALPEATPLRAGEMLHLGNRMAINQALSRLARSGRLMRICRGIYMRPIETRFGLCAPSLTKVIASLSALWGETMVPSGGAAANVLGLTTQNQVQTVLLTSGPDRRLFLGGSAVRLRHAPRWQLVAPYRPAGNVIRALSWLGPEEVEDALQAVLPKLSAEDLEELAAARTVMPAWMAEPVSALVARG